jgi:hypothetical protein
MEGAMNTTNRNQNQNQNESNQESDRAASTIQRCYRQHSAITGAASLTLMYGDFGSVAVAVAAMTYDSSDDSSDVPDVAETTEHQDDDDDDEYAGEDRWEEYDSKKTHLKGILAVTKTVKGLVVLLASDSLVDEDDVIAVATIFQGESTGAAAGGGAGGGASGGAGGGATTSPQ